MTSFANKSANYISCVILTSTRLLDHSQLCSGAIGCILDNIYIIYWNNLHLDIGSTNKQYKRVLTKHVEGPTQLGVVPVRLSRAVTVR